MTSHGVHEHRTPPAAERSHPRHDGPRPRTDCPCAYRKPTDQKKDA